jgi:ribonucleoside-diphosphate reductase alpha chain
MEATIENPKVDFKKVIADFVFASRYARYSEKLGRREVWEETVDRVRNMHLKKFRHLDEEHQAEIRWAFDMVKAKKVVPSMRSLQFGGKAIEVKNSRMFNCSVTHIHSLRSFAEVFYLLLCGCGVGFGVSKHFLGRLPDLVTAEDKNGTVLTYVVEDTIEGWADSIEALMNCYFRNTPYTGRKIIFDYSRIRHKGTPLKTGGGKAPGYKGLKNAHVQIKTLLDHIIEDLGQTRLKPINAYDIIMHASDAVLSGGIRRSATICIFDKDDEEMMNSKTYFNIEKKFRFAYDDETKTHHGKVKVNGKTYEVELTDWDYQQLQDLGRISWFHIEPQRGRSNNSVLLLRDKTSKEEFNSIMKRTMEFGEPGFVFANHPWQLFNPCCEIGFIPVTDEGVCGVQFCNLTSINGAKIESADDFFDAARAATIIGTLQASYTEMKYLQPVSKQLTEDEALLGVSITGIMDRPDILLDPTNQKRVAEMTVVWNREWAKIIGIKPAARITCVKPEGSSSLILESASGIHPHHARRYFRRVQGNKMDPVIRFLKKTNPHMIEDSIYSANKTDEVVTFPIEIDDKAIVKKDLTALKHLEYIKSTQLNWVKTGTTPSNKKDIEHNVSCTVMVKEDEWSAVTNYIYDNKQYFCAVSLIPATGDKLYKQAPMEEITTAEDEEKLQMLLDGFKTIDFKQLKEEEDNTNLAKEVACAGGACEIA